MVTLTPGSRRKLLRHIDEELNVNELAKAMSVSVSAMRDLILSDDELKSACMDNGTLRENGEFILNLLDRHPSHYGMNPDFIRKVRIKRRKEALARKAKEAKNVDLEYRAINVRKCGDINIKTTFDITFERKPTVREIIESVIVETDFTYQEIIGPSRAKLLTSYRHEAIALVVELRPDLSLPVIGRHFGGRDHTTIIHAARKHGIYRKGDHYGKKVKPDQVKTYSSLKREGVGLEKIAQKLGVTRYALRQFETEGRLAA